MFDFLEMPCMCVFTKLGCVDLREEFYAEETGSVSLSFNTHALTQTHTLTHRDAQMAIYTNVHI